MLQQKSNNILKLLNHKNQYHGIAIIIMLILSTVIMACRPKSQDTCTSESQDKKFKTYYQITVKSGLVLRSKPSKDGKRLALIPHLTVGKIKEITGKEEIINNIKGHWLKTEYEDKTGWIFSGYTYMSYIPQSHEPNYEPVSYLSLRFISLIPSTTLSHLKKVRKKFNTVGYQNFDVIETIDAGNFYIKQIKYRNEPGMDSAQAIFFQHKASGIIYSDYKGGYEEKISSKYIPFKNIFWTSERGCTECCAVFDENINMYIITKSKIYKFSGRLIKNKEASCNYGKYTTDLEVFGKFDQYCGTIMGPTTGVYTKIDKERKIIYQYVNRLKCDYTKDKAYLENYIPDSCMKQIKMFPKSEKSIIAKINDINKSKSRSSSFNTFVAIHILDNSVTFEIYKNKGIPKDFISKWEDTKLVPIDDFLKM